MSKLYQSFFALVALFLLTGMLFTSKASAQGFYTRSTLDMGTVKPNQEVELDPRFGWTKGTPSASYQVAKIDYFEQDFTEARIETSITPYCGSYQTSPVIYYNSVNDLSTATKIGTAYETPQGSLNEQLYLWIGANVIVPSGSAGDACQATINVELWKSGGGVVSRSVSADLQVQANISSRVDWGTDFGRVVRSSGNVVLDPVTGKISTPETNYRLGQVELTGAASEAVTITFPSSVSLSGSGGSVDYYPRLSTYPGNYQSSANYMQSGDSLPLSSAGERYFWIGGTIDTNSATGAGNLSGQLNITFNYTNL